MEMTREQMLGTITNGFDLYTAIQVWRDKKEGQGE